MILELFLGSMKLKESGNERILAYYNERGEWYKIQGDDTEEFINNLIKKLEEKETDKIKINNRKIDYFKNLIPPPKKLEEDTYKELYKKILKIEKIKTYIIDQISY